MSCNGADRGVLCRGPESWFGMYIGPVFALKGAIGGAPPGFGVSLDVGAPAPGMYIEPVFDLPGAVLILGAAPLSRAGKAGSPSMEADPAPWRVEGEGRGEGGAGFTGS